MADDFFPLSALLPTAKLNSEAIFALGGKLPFSAVTLYDLELISGISDHTGLSLLHSREEIIKAASRYSPSERYKAFELAKGIGRKTAITLERYLILE